ncbi:MAG: dTDP-4-dehydrorhamnose 3,5-epimerase [Propylenella sp.]
MALDVTPLAIEAVKLIRPQRFGDARGYLVETWNQRKLAEAGIEVDFVQDNCSFSSDAGTIRGLHYQRPPAAQAKLVRVVRGRVFDVAVDLRGGSATYGRYAAAELTADGGEQLLVPVGFAHGFCTLESNTKLAYKLSDFYAPECDAGIIWNDPDIGIDWPLEGRQPILSEKDMKLPRLADGKPPF